MRLFRRGVWGRTRTFTGRIDGVALGPPAALSISTYMAGRRWRSGGAVVYGVGGGGRAGVHFKFGEDWHDLVLNFALAPRA